ncbi:Ni/Co efflux regulator RcnB [Paraburkholderia sp. GAS448]|uniref:hypothetical protein n=1 Tax=Paraburkholderia sp. GAS448 TaxID=3035136 RepID=UPI003D1E6A08
MKLKLAAFAAVALTLAGAASANDFDHHDARWHRDAVHQRTEHRDARQHREERMHDQRMADDHREERPVR